MSVRVTSRFQLYSFNIREFPSIYHRDTIEMLSPARIAREKFDAWHFYPIHIIKTRKLKLLIRIRSTPDQTFPTKRGTNLRQDWKMKLTINHFAFLSHKKHWYMPADNIYILFLKREKSPAFSFICIHFFQPRKKEEAIMHGAKKQKHKNVKAQETKNVCNFY